MSIEEPLAGPAEPRGRLLRRAVILTLVLVVGLVLTLALSSSFNVHPDEHGYFPCSYYYTDHWLPPEIGARDSLTSYERPYGVSRLNDQYFNWFLSGRFLNLVEPLTSLPNFVIVRLFGVLLLALLVGLCLLGPSHTWLVAVILLSPQVWYVFAHLNNDAFPLLLSFALALQLAVPGSAFDRFLRDPRWHGSFGGGLLVGALGAVLIVEKKNFLVLASFLVFYLVWKQTREFGARHLPVKKLALVVAVVAAIAGGKLGMDLAIYGPDKAEAVRAYEEERAAPEFRLSNIDQPNSYSGVYLAAKGEPYSRIFTAGRWHVKTFQSFNGVYGYMEFFASDLYYVWVFLLQCGLFGWLAVRGWLLGGSRIRVLLLAATAATLGLVAASSYFSWSTDFQAQGRYLFPLLPVWAITAFEMRSLIDRVAIGLFGLLVASSLYSFVFIAFPALAFTR